LGGILGWAVIGAMAGVAAGLYMGEAVAVQPVRLKSLVRRQAPVRTGFLARLARQELLNEPLLRGLTLQVLPVSARTVELHGWVMTRAQRSIAQRAVRRVPGVETVINGILVRGEDDFPSTDSPDTA
jgi:hypothetical protein